MGARFGEAAEEQAKAGLGLAMAREKDAAALGRQKESSQATREAAAIRAMGATSAARIKAANVNFFDTGMADAYLKLYGEISSSASGQVMSPEEIHKQIKDVPAHTKIAEAWEQNAGIQDATRLLKTSNPPSLDEFKAKLIEQNPKVDLSTMRLGDLSVEDFWKKTYGG